MPAKRSACRAAEFRSALQIHGRSFSQDYLADLQTANGNEADESTKLWELWFDLSFSSGKADLKIGQQSLDNECLASTNSGRFVNTMAGWALRLSDDLDAGGPAYPLSSLGARVQSKPGKNATILAGVFDDNPPGDNFDGDPQEKDAAGVRFSLNTGALFIAELQYAKAAGLAGVYKIGFWYDTAAFPDQRFGTDGLSLADPDSNGDKRAHHGNYSLYGAAAQTVWESGSRTLNLFARIMGAPDPQNLIDFFANGGLTVAAPLPGREDDVAGIDFRDWPRQFAGRGARCRFRFAAARHGSVDRAAVSSAGGAVAVGAAGLAICDGSRRRRARPERSVAPAS